MDFNAAAKLANSLESEDFRQELDSLLVKYAPEARDAEIDSYRADVDRRRWHIPLDAGFISERNRAKKISLSPEVTLSAAIQDQMHGRVDFVEVRGSGDPAEDQLIYEGAVEIAMQQMSSVRLMLSEFGTIEALEATLKNIVEDLRESGELSSEANANCWTNTRKVFSADASQLIEITERCCAIMIPDPCGFKCRKTCRQLSRRVVWSDGNADSAPPKVPPPFTPSPWNNKLPFFASAGTGRLESDWGWRRLGSGSDFHPGIDISAPVGTEVRAGAAGTVITLRPGTGQSNGVHLNVGGQRHTYWHISPADGLKQGQAVKAGDVLGTITSWARPHLHHARYQDLSWPSDERARDRNSLNPCP